MGFLGKTFSIIDIYVVAGSLLVVLICALIMLFTNKANKNKMKELEERKTQLDLQQSKIQSQWMEINKEWDRLKEEDEKRADMSAKSGKEVAVETNIFLQKKMEQLDESIDKLTNYSEVIVDAIRQVLSSIESVSNNQIEPYQIENAIRSGISEIDIDTSYSGPSQYDIESAVESAISSMKSDIEWKLSNIELKLDV